MEPSKTEGVILHALNFRDYDQILTIFTYTEGLVKGIVKGALRSQRNHNSSATSPLTRIEFLYVKGNSDLLKCSEISPLSQYLQLRNELTRLEAACDIAQAIISSQMPHHPSPDLYRLLVWSLDKISLIADPLLLAISFRLKLLRHDGVLHISDEVLYPEHSKGTGLSFTQAEMKLLETLTYLKNLNEIAAQQSTLEFRKKVNSLFQELT